MPTEKAKEKQPFKSRKGEVYDLSLLVHAITVLVLEERGYDIGEGEANIAYNRLERYLNYLKEQEF